MGLTLGAIHKVITINLFFKDLIEDWSSRSPPDLLSFIPYDWNFQFIVKVCSEDFLTLVSKEIFLR